MKTRPPRRPATPALVRLLALYPRAWRERYGEELAELLAREPASPPAVFAVLGGALDARLHPRLAGQRASGGASAEDRLRAATLTLCCAFAGFVVVALAFVEAISDLVTGGRADAERLPSLTPLAIGAGVALIGVVAALAGWPALRAWLATTRRALAAHRRTATRLVIPLLALASLVAAKQLGRAALRGGVIALPGALAFWLDAVWHGVALLLALVVVRALAAWALRRPAVSLDRLRRALTPAAALTALMALIAAAASLWLAQAGLSDARQIGASHLQVEFVGLLALMIAFTGLAAATVRRGWRAR